MMEKEQDIEAPAAKPPNKRRFPWRPTLKDRLFAFLLTDHFRTGLQLAVGQFGVSLFPLVPRMHFSQDCLAATLYLVCSLLISQSNNMGDKILGCASLIGPAWLGAIFGGCVVSLAVATQHPTVFLCIFGVLFMIPFATVRAGSNPAISNANGIPSMLVFGVVVLNSQFVNPLRTVWREVVANLILDAVIAGLAAALSGAFIIPSLAGDDLRSNIAATLRGLGQSVSGYAGFIFAPDQHELALQKQATKRTLCKFVKLEGGEEPSQEAFFEELQHATMPRLQRDLPRPGGPGGVLAGSLQPLLGSARMKTHVAACEPAFLQRSPIVGPDWGALIAAVETLVIRVAALESLLEGRSQYLRSAFFRKYFGVDMLPSFRMIHGLIAVACAKLGAAVRCHHGKQEVRLKVIFGNQWSLVRKVLTADIEMALDNYWERVRQEEKEEGVTITPAAEMRALLFVTMLTGGIVDAMEAVEKAVAKALDMQQPGVHEGVKLTGSGGADKNSAAAVGSKSLREAYSGGAQQATSAVEPSPSGHLVGPAQISSMSVEAPLPAAGQQEALKPRTKQEHWLVSNTVWVKNVLPNLFCLPVYMSWWTVYTKQLPQAFSSRGAFVKAMKDRFFQFWLKFWLTCTVILVLMLVLSEHYERVREYYPFFGFVSVPIVMSERVEMTISKGVLRIGGTIVGGTLGFLVMLRSGLATNPYLLMLIVVVTTFLFGFGGRTQYLYAIMLTLISANALVLCQATKFPCVFCDEHGSAHYYAARVLSISLGCLAPMLVSNLILPWFASQTALDTLAAAFMNSFDLIGAYVHHFYDINRAEAGLDPGVEVPPFSTTALQERVAQPLSRVQMALAKESVLWKRGWYTFPPAVKRTLVELMDLQNRLAALDIVIRQPPSISGRYTGSAHRLFLEGARGEYDRMMVSLGVMVKTACSLLRGDDQASYAQLKADIQTLEAHRGELRTVYLRQREELHNAVKNAANRDDILTHDDAARFLSWVWMFIKSIDKAEAVAKAVLMDECRRRDNAWSWIK
ncbi:g3460 [Coccomyxa elongata]